jgi:hypothetical protein
MRPGSRFFDRSLAVAQRFLQTAVVIDDRAFLRRELIEPLPHTVPEPPTPSTAAPIGSEESKATISGDATPRAVTSVPDADPHRLDAETVIESFAKSGIICSVLQRFPDENPAASGTAHQLFDPADILIIDWQTRRADGTDSHEETLRFLGTAVAESTRESPQQLRLVIVYTGAIDLFAVAAEASRKIESVIGTAPQKDGEFAFQLGPIRVAVLGKPSNKRTAECKTQQIEGDADLASWATKEFTIMTSGLVSNVALDAMAEIRRMTHRMLTRFSPALDAPFLAHRALLNPPDEGNTHLLPLIVSELEAILEDKVHADLLSDDSVRDWLATRTNPLPFVDDAPLITTEAQAKQAVDDICIKGVRQHTTFAVPDQPAWIKKFANDKDAPKLGKLTDIIAAEKTEGGNERFEILMSLRPRYGTTTPMLALGTILKSINAAETSDYWLCMQPSCDCYIRTGGPARAFPLLLLRSTDEHFNLLAEDGESFIRLRWDAKPYKVQMIVFEANSANQAVVSQREEKGFSFQSADPKIRLYWLGELKSPQAQRVAHSLSSETGRVGLTESEWMRRSAK